MIKLLIVVGFIGMLPLGWVYANSNYQIVPNYTDRVTPPTVYLRPDANLQARCIDCSFVAYRLVRQLNCGAAVAIDDPGEQPTCSLVPRVTTNGAVELTWDTKNANVAFIDKGVGHVTPGPGSRIITPTDTTEYNMTVVNDGGLVNVCSARVEVNRVDIATPVSDITPPEVDITINDAGAGVINQEGFWAALWQAWWWLIGLIVLFLYWLYNKVKSSLGI